MLKLSSHSYVNGAIDHFKYYVRDHGEGGKQELNSVCSKHVITLGAGTGFSYNGVKIEDGTLKLIFNPTCLGTNTHQIGEYLAKAVSEAPQPEGASTLSYAARHAVQKDYDPKIGALLKKAQDILQSPKLKFDCNFEEIGKALKGGKDVRDDWETNLGDFAYRYYESFVDVLKREKFDSDEMLREGFEEGIPEMSVQLKVVEKIKGYYNETVLEGGAVVMQVCNPSLQFYPQLTHDRQLLRTGALTSTTRARRL